VRGAGYRFEFSDRKDDRMRQSIGAD